MNASKYSLTAVLFFLLLMTACANGKTGDRPITGGVTAAAYVPTGAPLHTPSATPTFTPTPSPTPTFTPTPSPTPTFTPTPRATPLTVVGDPRAAQLHAPIPQDGASCGLVDVFDFPLDPPNAASITAGGRDFGVYRSRYDKYHAGEDWWIARGRSNFGQPVYSIGHGRVTYAEPLGWGRDQGVIIVRHTFTDGSTVLSFYGHLDPPSVTLRAGDCVTRGQQIGEIGQPRTAPHLHFEMRTHMPAEPGPGYWWEDPTKAGWLPPSQTIWTQRLMASPGVMWTQDPIAANTGTTYIGTAFGDVVLTLDGTQLTGTTLSDGLALPAFADLQEVAAAALDADGQTLYVADRLGSVGAFRLTDLRSDTADTAVTLFTTLWHTELDVVGIPALLPLPGGGLALLARGEVFAVATDGRLLWQQDIGGRPFAWNATDEWLLLATTGSAHAAWATDGTQPFTQVAPFSGYPLLVGTRAWLYAENGVYRLPLDGQPPQLLYALPTGFLDRSSIAALPGGGALLAHADVFDQRLIAFNEDGTVRWQRSFAGLLLERQRLLHTPDGVYLTSFNSQGDVSVYAVDVETAVLTHIFTGGTRMPVMQNTWVVAAVDNYLLLNIGGGDRVLLDARGAETAVIP